MGDNFYGSVFPEYYYQKPTYNFGNAIIHSDTYKKLNPLRARYDYNGNDYVQMPFFLGVIPQFYWLYGNLDYSFNKYQRHIQSHDDWYPDRKNKALGHKQGSMCSPIMKNSKYMALVHQYAPKGCIREIKKFQQCAQEKNAESCFNEKISIMEVCPDHVLDQLKERKKWTLRAESIDN